MSACCWLCVDRRIEQVTKDIDQAKIQFEEEKRRRQNKETYDAMAGTIWKYQSRDESNRCVRIDC